ncbi:MAG: hypothetical protein Q9214_005682 [Letrouitia sp. 1 TL-2023]
MFCKSCVFFWLRPLDVEASDEDIDVSESDDDAESETNPEDSQMTERGETRRSTNENASEDNTEEDGNSAENASDDNTEEDGSSVENASDDGTDEDGDRADISNQHQLINGWRWISRAAASQFINGRPADEWEIWSGIEAHRTFENRRYRSGNNTCPLCRFELFPKPCHSGSSLVLISVIRLFDAAYDHLDIDMNEAEQKSRRNFVEYLEFNDVVRDLPDPDPDRDSSITRAYALFEAMRYMRGFIDDLSSECPEPHEGELLAELSEFIETLDGKIGYFNLNRDPHFLLREYHSYSGVYSGVGPSERRNATC